MPGWTQADIDERNHKQGAQGFLGGLSELTSTPDRPSIHERKCICAACENRRALRDLMKVEPREGRVKGIAAAADRTCNGRVYHSKAEAVKALELYRAQKAGAFRRVTQQVPYPIIVNGVKICKVVVDFEIEENDGTISAIEVKGWSSEVYKLKAKLLLACYPKLRYTVVDAHGGSKL